MLRRVRIAARTAQEPDDSRGVLGEACVNACRLRSRTGATIFQGGKRHEWRKSSHPADPPHDPEGGCGNCRSWARLAVPDAGARPRRADQGRLHAALQRHLREARQVIERPSGSTSSSRAASSAGARSQYFKVDDESEPSKATDNVNKLIKRDKVDVARRHRALRRRAGDGEGRRKDTNTLLIIPNAGADAITGPDVRAEHRAQLVLELAAGLRDGQGRWPEGRQERAMTITWNYAAGQPSRRRASGGLREGRRQGRQGAQPAVPERRVPGAAHRDRRAEARRGVRVLRRRRRGEVRQGLRRGRPQQDDPALRPGLPDRRHARGAGRGGAGHADDAALRRQPRQRRRTTPSARPSRRPPTRRSPTSTRCRATTRRRSSPPA